MSVGLLNRFFGNVSHVAPLPGGPVSGDWGYGSRTCVYNSAIVRDLHFDKLDPSDYCYSGGGYGVSK